MPVDLENEDDPLVPELHSFCCHFPNTAWVRDRLGTLSGPSNSRERKQIGLSESTKMKKKNNDKNITSLISQRSSLITQKVSQGVLGNKGTRGRWSHGTREHMHESCFREQGNIASQNVNIFIYKVNERMKDRCSRDFISGHLSITSITKPQIGFFKYSLCEF